MKRILLALVLALLWSVPAAAQVPPIQALLTAVTTGTSTAIRMDSNEHATIEVSWGSSTSAGAGVVEEAFDSGETFTWTTIGTFAWAAAEELDTLHITPGLYRNVRVRITTTVVGGTVTIRAIVER